MKLAGKIVLVAGVDPFVGRSVALFLGSQGATVYLLKRWRAHRLRPYEMLHPLAERITAAGGVGIAVPYDHDDDHQIKALFEQIEAEQGHLDILVNNATARLDTDAVKRVPFWFQDSLKRADEIALELRLTYLSSSYAAPLLLRSEKALLVNLSTYAYYGDAAYSAINASLDRMTWHMAQQFKGLGVAAVSIGIVSSTTKQPMGPVIDALYDDPDLMTKSGQAVIGDELAASYGLS